MPRTVIFANGILPDRDSVRGLLRADDILIAADGGTRHVLDLGRVPRLVVGDMDSLEKADWKKLEEAGVEIEMFPRDKNETDLELALDRAVEMGNREILILGALGGRVDQTLGIISLLGGPQLSAFDLRLDDGQTEAFLVRARSNVEGRRGDLVSLIPWGGEASGIRTEGLKWPLSNETLFAHKTRGISNEMTSDRAQIQIENGFLLVIHIRQSRIINQNRKLETP